MDAIKLSRAEQDIFFRRYDMFERKAFKTMGQFKRSSTTRTSSNLDTNSTFGYKTQLAIPTREEVSLREDL